MARGPQRRFSQEFTDGAVRMVLDGPSRAALMGPLRRLTREHALAADGLHRAPLERALARQGWKTVAEGSADLAVEWTGDGYHAAFDGAEHWFASLPELTTWARRVTAKLTPDRPRPGLLPAEPRLATGALAEMSAISAYFEIATDPAEHAEPAWRPLTDLFTDRKALSAMIADVGHRLGTSETRVAASILFQGLTARLWSPVVGAILIHDLLVDLAPIRVHWRPAPTGPLPLWAPRPVAWEITDPRRVAEPLYRNVVSELMEPLARAVQEITEIAPGLLWGNAASALAGTLWTVTRQRPELAARAIPLGHELLSRGVLRGRGELAEPAPGHLFFIRHSCCLYYRLPGGGKCGDCALLNPRTRHEQWAHAVQNSQGAS
ncbi:(2Fe-2S)-binding protein [Streptosporangium sp. NPDC087985]|uniref:(2Fe-2S)-binding protein n=1 Tax=Streptosporangium sp. NPDC087985 TaxID=3366196 RepID=UPI003812F99F